MRDASGRWPSTRTGACAIAALVTALLISGCGAGDRGEPGAERTAAATPAREVLLQPATDQGPAPFTPSTALEGAPAVRGAPAATGVTGAAPAGRSLTGATPGLYGGTLAVASCNVEQQINYLTADQNKARAFAKAAGIPENNLAPWLRGLTPVLLRADTRVTSHGFQDGGATVFQSVLQAGTAVLVDHYGTPRVRCACGNPLRTPAAAPGAGHAGQPWAGYRPDRVVVITPTANVVTKLVIADAAGNSWIERRTGSGGDGDRRPDVLPPCDPATCDLVAAPPAPLPDGPADQPPTGPASPARPHEVAPPADPAPRDPVSPPAPDDSAGVPLPDGPAPEAPAVPDGPDGPAVPETPAVPDGPGEQVPAPEPPPSFDDLFPGDTAPRQPETFEG
ncbi:DUF6777 domain-containing protein [Streptomyces sp. NPDC053493]|uniref:DUF6777 domain-containing protein n=1 Tax=Streptomyces sp. NPDC053493 TaxID=3365705 RepID=UPI0037D74195